VALIEVGRFHRLGIALRGDGDGPARWFTDVLGAEVTKSAPEPGDTHWTTMLHIGSTGIALFAAAPDDTTGTIARFVDRYGAGLHSLAWRVSDLEGAEARVRDRGMAVTGVNRAARHWFLHPKETFGILIEITDQAGPPDRTGATTPGPAREIAWMTAVVGDASAPRTLFEELFGARGVHGLPAGPAEEETTVDLAIGDVILRLVEPRSERSRYASTPGGGVSRDGMHSLALRVDDLDQVPVPLVERVGDRGWSAPPTTLGLRLEWTTATPPRRPGDW
jgi:catechol 2,3-dioxygenase-like lactoylglutathione lyase family enzyme